MKVLLFNGSPHKGGCIFTVLSEIAGVLAENGVDSEMIHIGVKPVRGCIDCRHCADGNGCVFKDELYTEFVGKIDECDGLIIGSPVYYAGPAGSVCALLDRVFFSAGKKLRYKPAACVVNCRRGGASAAFDRLNKYFTINRMPVVSSIYWNATHGGTPEQVRQDLEGMQIVRTLGHNMAYLLKSIAKSGEPHTEETERVWTNFIR